MCHRSMEKNTPRYAELYKSSPLTCPNLLYVQSAGKRKGTTSGPGLTCYLFHQCADSAWSSRGPGCWGWPFWLRGALHRGFGRAGEGPGTTCGSWPSSHGTGIFGQERGYGPYWPYWPIVLAWSWKQLLLRAAEQWDFKGKDLRILEVILTLDISGKTTLSRYHEITRKHGHVAHNCEDSSCNHNCLTVFEIEVAPMMSRWWFLSCCGILWCAFFW